MLLLGCIDGHNVRPAAEKGLFAESITWRVPKDLDLHLRIILNSVQ